MPPPPSNPRAAPAFAWFAAGRAISNARSHESPHELLGSRMRRRLQDRNRLTRAPPRGGSPRRRQLRERLLEALGRVVSEQREEGGRLTEIFVALVGSISKRSAVPEWKAPNKSPVNRFTHYDPAFAAI